MDLYRGMVPVHLEIRRGSPCNPLSAPKACIYPGLDVTYRTGELCDWDGDESDVRGDLAWLRGDIGFDSGPYRMYAAQPNSALTQQRDAYWYLP